LSPLRERRVSIAPASSCPGEGQHLRAVIACELKRLVDADLFRRADSYVPGYFVDRDGLELVFVVVIVNGLQDGAGAIENGKGAAAYVCLQQIDPRVLDNHLLRWECHGDVSTHIKVPVSPEASRESLEAGLRPTWEDCSHTFRRPRDWACRHACVEPSQMGNRSTPHRRVETRSVRWWTRRWLSREMLSRVLGAWYGVCRCDGRMGVRMSFATLWQVRASCGCCVKGDGDEALRGRVASGAELRSPLTQLPRCR